MKNNFDYLSVPDRYLHCLNDRCVKGGQCLRQLAWENRDASSVSISVLNPGIIPEDTNACPHFRSTQKVRMAWGLKHLFDRFPHKTAIAARRQIIGHFGKTLYYRYYREERPLTPNDQRVIGRILHQHGITEAPQFERYTEHFDF